MATKTAIGLRFGDWLVNRRVITNSQLSAVLSEQRLGNGRLGEILTRLNILPEEQVVDLLGEYLGTESIHFDDLTKIDAEVAQLIPESIARRYCLLATGIDTRNSKIIIVMADPLDVVAMDTIRGKLSRDIDIKIAPEKDLLRAIEYIYHGSNAQEKRLRDLVDFEGQNEDTLEEVGGEDFVTADIRGGEEDAEKAPVIKFVDLLLNQAVKSRASDIHIEPQEKSMDIRMRVDGSLQDNVPPPRKMQAAVVARIKILSRMNIAERRLPQDGRFKIRSTGHDIDVRVSAIPTIYGEKIVMRILDASAVNHDLDKLGIETNNLKVFKHVLSQPHGINIVTGPTGSGKSTTLYAALNFLRDPRMNITTVEDPVEYRLSGINQIQIKPDIDLDFATCLRAILRQDPDIIMIGEIRDKETVEIAIKASLTGHLVLSTFHTNDAPSAVSRLVYMGIEPYLLSSTVNLIMAQRLVKTICQKCKSPITPDENTLRRLKIDTQTEKVTFYQGKGCPACQHTGYLGRAPIFEFLPFDNELRQKIVSGATEIEIRQHGRKNGFGSLLDSGIHLVKQGITTAQEVLGATFSEDLYG